MCTKKTGAPVSSLNPMPRSVATSSAMSGPASAKFCPTSLVRPAAVSRATAFVLMPESSACSIVRTPVSPAVRISSTFAAAFASNAGRTMKILRVICLSRRVSTSAGVMRVASLTV